MASKKNFTKKQKIIGVVIFAFFIFIILYAIATAIYRSDKIQTTVKFAPYNATVLLNDSKVSNNSTAWLLPGNYHLVVKLNDHFEVHEEDITIDANNHYILGTLSALDDEGVELANKRDRDYQDAEGFIGNLINEKGAKEQEENPILKYLPINNTFYSISYAYNANQKLEINVKTTLENLDFAIAKLKTLSDVKLSSLNLNFLFQNPYKDSTQNNNTDPIQFIRAAYNLSDKYKILEGKTSGDYYYTRIYIDDYAHGNQYANYHIVLKKQSDGTWTIPFVPQPILTSYNTSDISTDLLDTINSY